MINRIIVCDQCGKRCEIPADWDITKTEWLTLSKKEKVLHFCSIGCLINNSGVNK